jgi:hypothetical protein
VDLLANDVSSWRRSVALAGFWIDHTLVECGCVMVGIAATMAEAHIPSNVGRFPVCDISWISTTVDFIDL